MGARAGKCFPWRNEDDAANAIQANVTPKRFADPWWRKYDAPTDGFVDSSGVLNRLPLRLESTEVIVYGFVDAQKMWAEFEALGEPFVPVLVGGKAVVTIWFNNFVDTDCGGAYLETWYNTFVTPKGEPQLELPCETPFSAIIQDPRSLSYLQRVCCSEAPKSTGAGAVAIEGGRSIWGFPKHPELGKITFDYVDDQKKVVFNATHSGKQAISLRVDIPQEGEGTVTIPLEIETGPDALISGPRLGGTHKGCNGALQTRYGVAFKCTQHVKLWDAETDSLEFGDDIHYATPIKGWNFEPVLKVHSPDFKIIAHKPSNWLTSEDTAKKMQEIKPATLPRFGDEWFRKYDTPTAGLIDSSGVLNRLPLRLESTEVIVYGLVDAQKMWADFEALGEPFVPVLVGGKAVVTIWCNNFIDTDCGGAYLETWYNTFVTPKGEPQLELPYESPFSAVIQDPRSLSYLQRVCCSESPKSTGAGAVAIEGGRSIWGFPKHPELGKITFDYVESEGKERVVFEASHSGKKAMSLKVEIPQDGGEGTVTIPLELETGPDALIGGPRLGGAHKGHNGSQQTRYGVAFKCTQHVKPWNAETDSLEFGEDLHYATPIKGWSFEPVLKVHSPDFKIIAHKPSNWISGDEAAKMMTSKK